MFDRKAAQMLARYKKLREDVQYYGKEESIDKDKVLKDVKKFFVRMNEIESSIDPGKERERIIEIAKLGD